MIRQKTIYEPRPCLNCGTIIQSPKKTQKFCCISCNATYYAKIKKPEGIIRCKKCMYKEHIISGTFELRTAYILDKMLENNDIISWEYTNDTIKYISYDNKEHNYLLDFKYIDLNNDIKYIEVKGVKTNIDEYKWRAAEEQELNLDKWFLEDIKLKEKQYNITNDQLEKLFDECVENYKNNKITKMCKECGKTFQTMKTKETDFCNSSCAIKYYNKNNKNHNGQTKMKYKKICPVCGKQFISTAKKVSNCCSEKCYNKKYNIGEISYCNCCGNEFIISYYKQAYCSDKCKYKNSKTIILKKCEQCGKEFYGNANSKYCSDNCRKMSRRKILICKECGNEFYGKGNTHFCSKECKQKHNSTTHKIDYITLKK